MKKNYSSIGKRYIFKVFTLNDTNGTNYYGVGIDKEDALESIMKDFPPNTRFAYVGKENFTDDILAQAAPIVEEMGNVAAEKCVI